MSLANPLWGAPRIHGELLKLGIDIGQTSVAKYMAPRRRPRSQGWRTFLLNHVDGIASIDLFVVPTISFRLLYGLLVLRHGRRRIMWLGVTARIPLPNGSHAKSCGWEAVPNYLVRARDRLYAEAFTRRIRAMGIRDRPTAPRSPWQNGYRTTDRLDQTRMPGSRDHNWRATPAPYPAFVPAILQRHPNAPVIGQGLTANEIRPGGRPHSSAADPRRIAPSLRPELIFDRHSQLQVGSCHCEAPDATLVVQIEAPSLAPPFSRAPIVEAEILLDRRHFSPRNLGPISKVQLCFCWSRLLDRKLARTQLLRVVPRSAPNATTF